MLVVSISYSLNCKLKSVFESLAFIYQIVHHLNMKNGLEIEDFSLKTNKKLYYVLLFGHRSNETVQMPPAYVPKIKEIYTSTQIYVLLTLSC